jgi:Cu(I)/Ag(I) efflux system protein CusF
MNRFFNTLIISAGLSLAGNSAFAQMQMPMHDHEQHNAMPSGSQDDANALSSGEIKKVDKDAGKLTIQHGPLANVGMPGMTMAFKVQDAALIDQVKAGDKIRFRVERINGAYIVTKLEPAN